MIAKQEIRSYTGASKVFLARYRNLNNLVHWHSDCELLYVEKGEIELFIDGSTHLLKQGQACLIGRMQVHSIHTISESEISMIIFSPDLLSGSMSRYWLDSPVLSSDYDFLSLYDAIKEELLNEDRFTMQSIDARLTLTLIRILRGEPISALTTGSKERLLYMELLDDIDKNYSYYSSERGASFLCVSKVYFSSYFHKTSGMTFTEYLSSVRIAKALEMLATDKDLTVTEISSLCGFNSIRNFNYTFKRITGYSPSTLPEGYFFDDRVFRMKGRAESGFDPTLLETTLIESFG